jgi:hypothetical protein
MKVGLLRELASILQGRTSLSNQAGVTFAGKRDLFAALGYKRDLNADDYRERYERGGISGRIVESLPKATWRGRIEVVEDEDPDSLTTFEQAWQDLEKRLHIYSVLSRADILAGLGRYSVVLIGAEGDLSSELTSVSGGPDGVIYLTPYNEADAAISTFVTETDDPRFGQPAMYKFKRLSSDVHQRPREVHWSRVLHVADGILDEQLYGQPRLKRPWNYLDDLEKVTGGGSEAFWLRAHQGYQLDVPPTTEMEESDMADLQTEVDEYIHGMRRFMRTRGVELTTLGSDVSNFANQVDALITLIAGCTGIPKRILVGSEMGTLASTQDRTNWHERIQDRQVQFAAPQVLEPLIDRFIEFGVLPQPLEYEIRWPIIQNLDEEQRANVADKLAGVNTKIKETVITGAEIRDRVLQLPMLEEVEEEPEETPEEMEERIKAELLLELGPPTIPPTEPIPGDDGEGGEEPPITAGKKEESPIRTLISRRGRHLGKIFTWPQTDISEGCRKPSKKH